MDINTIKAVLKKHGIPEASADHPIYSSGSTIHFISRSGTITPDPEMTIILDLQEIQGPIHSFQNTNKPSQTQNAADHNIPCKPQPMYVEVEEDLRKVQPS